MKIIAFEEHYTLPAIADANPNSPRKLLAETKGSRGWPPPGIEDLGEGRIAAMDAAGIDVQILSNVPGVEAVELPQAVELATQANDAVVAAATKFPGRFLGFATLPMRDPKAAVAELERTVRRPWLRRRPDQWSRRRPLPRRPILLAGVRGRRSSRRADLSASHRAAAAGDRCLLPRLFARGVGQAGGRGPRLAHRCRNPLHQVDSGRGVRPLSRSAGDRRPPLRGVELDGVAD